MFNLKKKQRRGFNLKKKSGTEDIDLLRNRQTEEQEFHQEILGNDPPNIMSFSPDFEKRLETPPKKVVKNVDQIISGYPLEGDPEMFENLLLEKKKKERQINFLGTKVRNVNWHKRAVEKNMQTTSPGRKKRSLETLDKYETTLNVLSIEYKKTLEETLGISRELYSLYPTESLKGIVQDLTERYYGLEPALGKILEKKEQLSNPIEKKSGEFIASLDEVESFLKLEENRDLEAEYIQALNDFSDAKRKISDARAAKKDGEINQNQWKEIYVYLAKKKRKELNKITGMKNKINKRMFPFDRSHSTTMSQLGQIENERRIIMKDVEVVNSILKERLKQPEPPEPSEIPEYEEPPEEIFETEEETVYASSVFNLSKKKLKNN